MVGTSSVKGSDRTPFLIVEDEPGTEAGADPTWKLEKLENPTTSATRA